MQAAAALAAGRHHFTAFTPTETEHVFFDRTVLRCRWTRVGGALPGRGAGAGSRAGAGPEARGMLCLEIEADAFLRHMVRTLVGTMIEVGAGRAVAGGFRRLLDGPPGRRRAPRRPPHGLFLWDIRYGRSGRHERAR